MVPAQTYGPYAVNDTCTKCTAGVETRDVELQADAHTEVIASGAAGTHLMGSGLGSRAASLAATLNMATAPV